MLEYGSYIHTGGKSGGELLTLFDSYSYDGVSVGIWVIHTEVANLGVTLFGGYSYDGLNAVIWGPTHRGAKSGGHVFCRLLFDGLNAVIGVQHTEVVNLGVVSDAFWRLLL